MSNPYESMTDEEVLQAYGEQLEGVFLDTSGSDAVRWRAVANAALDDVGRSDLGIEAYRRKRRWNEPNPPAAPGTLPPTVPIAKPDKLAIVQGASPNYTYLNV